MDIWITIRSRRRAVSLDMLGNWDTRTTDSFTPSGTFTMFDPAQNRDHNDVNELEDIAGNTLDYDDAGHGTFR